MNTQTLRKLPFALALLFTTSFLAAFPMWAADSDDFNDGNDIGWRRNDPISEIGGTYAQHFLTNGAYRIRALASPAPGTGGVGPGRAGSLRTNITYTNFYASVDLVNWDTNLTQSVGMISHIRDVGLGKTDGYALTFNFRSDHTGFGEIDVTRFMNENPALGRTCH
jgi:hypothetical protein